MRIRKMAMTTYRTAKKRHTHYRWRNGISLERRIALGKFHLELVNG